MPILTFEESTDKRKPLRSLLSEILMRGNVPIDEDTSLPIRRVRCRQCGWKHELGEGVNPLIGSARARAHRRNTGHTDIRFRFDLLDLDEGPVDVRTPSELR